MKNSYSIAQRNAIVENHLWCINSVMKKHWRQISAAHADRDDVYQQLALRLIHAVENFDPDKGTLQIHIRAQLQFELRRCLTPLSLTGVTGLPQGCRRYRIASIDAVQGSYTDLMPQAA